MMHTSGFQDGDGEEEKEIIFCPWWEMPTMPHGRYSYLQQALTTPALPHSRTSGHGAP